jgi:hypothetical protein
MQAQDNQKGGFPKNLTTDFQGNEIKQHPPFSLPPTFVQKMKAQQEKVKKDLRDSKSKNDDGARCKSTIVEQNKLVKILP